jgi:hypothetical protein
MWWHEWGMQMNDFIVHENVPVQFAVDEDQCIRNVLNSFYSTNEVDSLLNVVEAPELPASITSLASKLSRYKKMNLTRIDQKYLRTVFSSSSMRNYTSILSGGYLFYKFGIAPLISDMRKIGHHLGKFSKEMARHVANAGKPVSVHFKTGGVFLPLGSLGTPLPNGYGPIPLQSKPWRVTYDGNASRTATVRGYRESKDTSDLFKKVDYLASRFGSTGPASFVWERIPFSFVLDWFVDLRDVLNRLDNALTGSRKKVLDMCITDKYEVNYQVVKQQRDVNETNSQDEHVIAEVALSKYHRKLADPIPIRIGASGRFGKTQAGILAALVAQKAANLKR